MSPGRGQGQGQGRGGALAVAFAAALGLLVVVGSVDTPYAVESPGPVQDVLGEVSGTPLIDIEGRRTYPTEGSLDLLTVRTSGGPGRTVGLVELVDGWLDPSRDALPESQLFAPDVTRQQVRERQQVEMSTSQEVATAAALAELGIPVGTTLRVAGLADGDGAAATTPLKAGDVITAVAGQPVASVPELRAALQEVQPGSDVRVRVLRDGEETTVTAPTSAADGATVLGVLIDPGYDFPFTVDIQIEDIGGPSAGMIFALGIIDKLTPGALTGGEHVAGTGTVSAEGRVGAIGGIRQKLVGARRAGAQWFLAPAANCDEVVGHVPDGLRVVRVTTVSEARMALEAVAAGEADDLPTCR